MNKKRLERDLQNKVLGGVCSGLGNYFDMDPTFWRVLFFFLFFFGCSGLLIYIILWIAMPSRPIGAPVENVAQDANGSTPKKNGGKTAGLLLIIIGAIGLLARPDLAGVPLDEIAEMSGFSTVSLMNRYVKKSAGYTACALRKRLFFRD